ncbi:MAG TPA: hypothetical protein VFS30_07625 [Dehalococcoidia bacterium]|nr:hypothetical protein [Dehalococcoidia bacterium]
MTTSHERLQERLARHAGFGLKRAGGEGDIASAAWISETLTNLGFDVKTTQSQVPWFDANVAELRSGEVAATVHPQPVVMPTGPDGVSGPLVGVHHTSEAPAARDAIALVIAPFARHATIQSPATGPLIKACAEAGALAVVLVTTGPSGEASLLNTDPGKPFAPLPIALLAPKDAEPFVAAAAARAGATLVVTGNGGHRQTPNLIATLRRGPQWLALSTPRTGWFTCAAERGNGIVAFLELAEWAARRFPNLSIFGLNTGGHEYMFVGTHDSVDAWPAPADTRLWVHLGSAMAARDRIAVGGRPAVLASADSHRILMTTADLLDDAKRCFTGLTGLEAPREVLHGAGELSTVIDRGYRSAFAVLGVHSWFHTERDTIETTSGDLLAPVIEAHKRLIEAAIEPGGKS